MLKLAAEILALAGSGFFATRQSELRERFTRAAARRFSAIARRRTLVCLCMGLAPLLIRAVLLPVWPAPRPVIYDEFSYLLQADTFAHGRLTNPPHPLWPFFESIYILQQPTYASKYPPGQALALAAGQRVLGNPWFGVWVSCGLLAAALCWALQGWLPPAWALFGSLIALDLCTFSYWMNSYWGGAVTAIGGALVAGAWVRIARDRKSACAWLFGLGAVILLLTRPYEGFLLAAPFAAGLYGKDRRAKVWLPIVAVVAAGIAWQAFYDYRVTGHPLRMPYQEYFSQYESIPPLNILPVQPRKQYRHFDLEFLDSGWTSEMNRTARSLRLPVTRAGDLYRTLSVIYGNPLWLLTLLAAAPVWLRARRLRLPAILAGILAGGAMLELVWYTHYAAPFLAILFILLVESVRTLRVWCGAEKGRFLAPAVASILIGTVLASDAVHVYRRTTPDRMQPINATKGTIEADLLKRSPGRHVVFVRYTGMQTPHEEWIYNRADIDGEAVVWAQDMGAENAKLMRYYAGRSFWLFEPDTDPVHLQRYP